MNTDELITILSKEPPKPRLKTPLYYAIRLLAVLLTYGMAILLVLGIRPDISIQFMRPMFILEIVLLILLAGFSVWVAIISMYPDMHQKRGLLNVPYIIFTIFFGFILVQLAITDTQMIVMQNFEMHNMQCAISIASISVIPSAIIFGLLRKGSSIHSIHSSAFAVLVATSMGYLMLRLCEQNDYVMHLIEWHYFPTFLFAILGAWLGKYLLRW